MRSQYANRAKNSSVAKIKRQKVEDEALVPELRLVTGRLPVTPVARETLVMVLLAPEIVLLVRVTAAAFLVASLVLSTLDKPTSLFVRERSVFS